jgi:hypothetical protein
MAGFGHLSRHTGAAGGTGSAFLGLPLDGTTGDDCDGLRRLWLSSGDRAARHGSTTLSSVPVPKLRRSSSTSAPTVSLRTGRGS